MIKEQEIMDIIVHGGDARSSSLKAVRYAQNGQWEKVNNYIDRAEKSIVKAHEVQTRLIQDEIRGNKSEITLLMIHAQDHLMNAITVKELSMELIEECKRRIEIEEKVKGWINND